ncbi:hypothetical protein XENOCAPTIV_027473, partial [Xenoophorus captivus]
LYPYGLRVDMAVVQSVGAAHFFDCACDGRRFVSLSLVCPLAHLCVLELPTSLGGPAGVMGGCGFCSVCGGCTCFNCLGDGVIGGCGLYSICGVCTCFNCADDGRRFVSLSCVCPLVTLCCLVVGPTGAMSWCSFCWDCTIETFFDIGGDEVV